MRGFLIWLITFYLVTVLGASDIAAESSKENTDLPEQIKTVKPASSTADELDNLKSKLSAEQETAETNVGEEESRSTQSDEESEQLKSGSLGRMAIGKLQQIYQDFQNSLLGGHTADEDVSLNPVEETVTVVDEHKVSEHNVTEELSMPANITANDTDSVSVPRPRVKCEPRDNQSTEINQVKVVNSTVLMDIIIPDPDTSAVGCTLVMFYAPWCPFSAVAAPHYNALAKSFPDINMLAVNAMAYGSLNIRFGIIAVPTLVLFHGSRAVAKYNDSEYVLEHFAAFLNKYTGLAPSPTLNLSAEDYVGPLPSVPTKETDYMLVFAWIFVMICATFGFLKTPVFQHFMEILRSNWNEAEEQHEHIE